MTSLREFCFTSPTAELPPGYAPDKAPEGFRDDFLRLAPAAHDDRAEAGSGSGISLR